MTESEELQLLRKAVDTILRVYDQHNTEVGYQILKFARDGIDITEQVDWGRVEEIKRSRERPFISVKDAMDYWRKMYESAFGSPYVPSNWARETSQMKLLMKRYDDVLLKEIMGVVVRLYPVKWMSPQFPRPTLGQMVSWLAAQAEPLARANLREIKEPEPVEETDILEKFESKGWL